MEVKSILPSSKFIKSIGAIILLLAIAYFVYYLIVDKPFAKNSQTNLKVIDGKFGELYSKDSDGDGLLDWEEDLYGTDKNKTDSNKNGIPDLAEVKPNGNDVAIGDNITENFSWQFASSVFALRGNNGLTEENIDLLIESSTDKIGNFANEKKYSIGDLRIAQSESSSATNQYLQQFTQSINKIPFRSDNSAELLTQALEEDSPDKLSLISTITAKYASSIDSLLQIPVPKKYTQSHLAIINSINQIMNLDISMSQAFTDPLKAYIALTNYQKVIDNYKYNLDIFSSLLKK